jgi:FkbM family methyltransferase
MYKFIVKKFRLLLNNSNIASIIYYRYGWWKPSGPLDIVLDSISKNKFFIIQIGANDGTGDDPLRKFILRDNWHGVLIEPQESVFRDLQKLYSDKKGIDVLHAAVDSVSGTKKLFKYNFSNYRWANALSSFNIEHLKSPKMVSYVTEMAKNEGIKLPNDIDSWITYEIVKTYSFTELSKLYSLNSVDLLVIDVEGYEFEILNTIPFSEVRIENILYESQHQDAKTKMSTEKLLNQHGYNLISLNRDTMAKLDRTK